jgi:Tfp pilus assembly protein PilF
MKLIFVSACFLFFATGIIAQKTPSKSKVAPSKAVEYYNKGTIKAEEGDLKEALKLFDKAVKENPDYFEALYNRATLKIKLLDYPAALTDFDQVLKMKPGFAGALLNRAAAKGYMKDYAGAQGDLDALLETKPSFARAYTMRGQMKKNLKDRDGACNDFAIAAQYGDKNGEKFAALLCTGKYGKGKIKPLTETYTLEWPDSSGWKAADSVNIAKTRIIRYVKGEETIKKWTELGTIISNPGITNEPVETAMKSLYAEQKLICPQAQLSQLDKNEDDEFPWIIFVIECPGKNSQSAIYHLVQGNTGQYIASVTMKTPSVEVETRDAWKDIFSKAKVEYK